MCHISSCSVHDHIAFRTANGLHKVRDAKLHFAFIGGKERNCHDTLGCGIILSGNLRLDVESAPVALVEGVRNFPRQPVVNRHIVVREVADGVAEEDALVAPSVRIHALRNVRRLLREVESDLYVVSADGIGASPSVAVAIGVADLLDCLTNEFREFFILEMMSRRDLARQGGERVLQLALESDACARVPFEVAVEDVGDDKVAGAVGMSDGAVFRCLNVHAYVRSQHPEGGIAPQTRIARHLIQDDGQPIGTVFPILSDTSRISPIPPWCSTRLVPLLAQRHLNVLNAAKYITIGGVGVAWIACGKHEGNLSWCNRRRHNAPVTVPGGGGVICHPGRLKVTELIVTPLQLIVGD